MVIADFSGDFLNAENTKQGDVIEIVGDATYEEIERMDKKKTVLNIPVSSNGKNRIYTPSMESGKQFIAAWGADTANWKGQKFTVDMVSYKSFGQTKKAVEAIPIVVVQKK